MYLCILLNTLCLVVNYKYYKRNENYHLLPWSCKRAGKPFSFARNKVVWRLDCSWSKVCHTLLLFTYQIKAVQRKRPYRLANWWCSSFCKPDGHILCKCGRWQNLHQKLDAQSSWLSHKPAQAAKTGTLVLKSLLEMACFLLFKSAYRMSFITHKVRLRFLNALFLCKGTEAFGHAKYRSRWSLFLAKIWRQPSTDYANLGIPLNFHRNSLAQGR